MLHSVERGSVVVEISILEPGHLDEDAIRQLLAGAGQFAFGPAVAAPPQVVIVPAGKGRQPRLRSTEELAGARGRDARCPESARAMETLREKLMGRQISTTEFHHLARANAANFNEEYDEAAEAELWGRDIAREEKAAREAAGPETYVLKSEQEALGASMRMGKRPIIEVRKVLERYAGTMRGFGVLDKNRIGDVLCDIGYVVWVLSILPPPFAIANRRLPSSSSSFFTCRWSCTTTAPAAASKDADAGEGWGRDGQVRDLGSVLEVV